MWLIGSRQACEHVAVKPLERIYIKCIYNTWIYNTWIYSVKLATNPSIGHSRPEEPITDL
jgi:hypothetical protein